jgi:hypothetical protein
MTSYDEGHITRDSFSLLLEVFLVRLASHLELFMIILSPRLNSFFLIFLSFHLSALRSCHFVGPSASLIVNFMPATD